MRIASIALKDYRIFEEAEIAFDQPMSIIRGASHQGKSSIGRAIKLALSKCSKGTDPRGAGANDQVRLNGHKAVIQTVIEGRQGPVGLRVTYGPNSQGRQQFINSEQDDSLAEAFARFMESNKDRLSCCLDSSYFTHPGTDRKSILAPLILPAEYEFDEGVRGKVEKHFGAQAWNSSPVGLIDYLYDLSYKARREAKAAVAGVHVPQKPQKPEYDDKDAIQEKLYDLRKKQQTEASKIKRGGTVLLGRLEQKIETLRKDREQAEAELKRANEEYARFDKLLLTSAATKKHQKCAEQRRAFDALTAKIEANSIKIETAVGMQGEYRAMLQDAVCPSCTQPISPDFVAAKIKEFDDIIEVASEAQRENIEHQKALGDVVAAEAALAADKANQLQVQNANAFITTITARLESINTDGLATKEELDKARLEEAEPADTSALDLLNTEITEWEQRLSPAIQYETTLKQIEQSTARRTELQAKVNDLESLCSYFGKDGIKATLLGEYAGAFMEIVNGVLEAWGYSAELDMEAGTFMVNGGIAVKDLSGSEETFFQIALQSAIAVQSGIRMIVVDPLDAMDENERGRAFGCIKAMIDGGQLDQAILIGHDLRRDPVSIDGVGVYYVENGTVERL